MKPRFYSYFIIALVTLGFPSIQPLHAQNLDNPGEYMTAVSKAHDIMNKAYMAYTSAAAHSGRMRKIERLRKQALESITNCKYAIVELPVYKGDNSLRQSSIDYVQLCYKVFNEDYEQIVNMEEIAEQSFDEMQAYLLLQEKTNEKIREAFEKMSQASNSFAAKYNVKIIESKNELSEKMTTASKLSHYRNEVYLVFFKCNWQDGKITEAINKKDLNSIEQGRNALMNYAKQGLAALDTLKSFEGDPQLASACRQALNYYQKLAQTDIIKLTDFFLKEENFSKMKKSFENKSQASRTKADVDAFNKSVNEMNAAVNTFNQANTTINGKRDQVVKNWIDTEKKFMDTHTPYYKA